MHPWKIILGGWLVWAAHFVAIYAIGSVWPGQDLARWLVVAATVVALVADGWILWLTTRKGRAEQFERWVYGLGRAGAVLSIVAVLWQGAPALVLGL